MTIIVQLLMLVKTSPNQTINMRLFDLRTDFGITKKIAVCL